MMDNEGDDLEELLLKELEGGESMANTFLDTRTDVSFNLSSPSTPQTKSVSTTTLAFCGDSVERDGFAYSAVDSVIDERGLPMIDFSTPHQGSLPSQRPPIGEIITTETQSSMKGHCIVKRLMVPGNFLIEDLQSNIKAIGPQLHLNPIEAIKQSAEKRIPFLLALMLRDYRQIGSTSQLRLIDGSGHEIIGTMPFSACDKDLKLTYGLILILSDVTVFKAPGGTKYLNITRRNVQSYYNNIKIID